MRVWLRDFSYVPYLDKFAQTVEDNVKCRLDIVDDGVLATMAEEDVLYPWGNIRCLIEFTGANEGKVKGRTAKKARKQ